MTRRRKLQRLLKVLCWGTGGLTFLGAVIVLVAVHAFPYPVEVLDPNRSGPLIFTDRDGRLLRSIPGADGRRSVWVPLEEIPSIAVLTFLVSEDQGFFEHGGVDVRGVARAAWLNLKERRVGYGGLTITMQLVRMIHSPNQERSWWNKLRESILALRLENRLDKNSILEQYLNRANFGNGTVGFEAAAQRYFGKPASALSVAEATFLAVLPRAPTAYNPFKGTERALARRQHIFQLLVKNALVSPVEVTEAVAQPLLVVDHPFAFKASHFVEWVRRELPPTVKVRGGVVRTTLDLPLQEKLEREANEHTQGLHEYGVQTASAVILDAQTSAVLAMVGSSSDAYADLNMATWRRHPGSALKPFVYALAIEDGDSPASIAYDIADVPSAYRVTDVVEERGPLRYRDALAGSHNLAAIHVLEKVGVERMIGMLKTAGLGPLAEPPSHYGLRLALGSAKVRLVDLAAAYGFLVKEGRVSPAQGFFDVQPIAPGPGSTPVRVERLERRLVAPDTAWMVMDVLSDPQPRQSRFGRENPLDLPFRVAAKTGTARGFADTVTVAVTEEYTVAAWSGRADGKPTAGLRAMDSAAPLVRKGLLLVAGSNHLNLPPRPNEVEAHPVCADSGLRPHALCPHQKMEYFRHGRLPSRVCDWHEHTADGGVVLKYPAIAAAWAARLKQKGGLAFDRTTRPTSTRRQ